MSDDFRSFVDGLAAESRKAREKQAEIPVNPPKSIYAPLGTKAEQPHVNQSRFAGQKRPSGKTALVQAFTEEYPQVVAWLHRNAERNDFARSLSEFLNRAGTLTEKQIAAVQKCVDRQNERKAQTPVAKEVDISRIETAFATARENGIATPKMNLGNFRFSLAPDYGKNAGAIYVKADEQYLGKIKDGRFYKVRECDDETEAEVIKVASNPHDAAEAYGQRTGRCSCCGRTLTAHASIDAKIGPICAEKYGW